MKRYRFEIVLAAALAALFVAFCLWQTPGDRAKLTRVEVDDYLRQIDALAPMEAAEKAEFLARMRAWGEADDGQPVYMLNAMRYFERLRKLPGSEAIEGAPIEANAAYEKAVAPILLKLGGYPLFGGDAMGVGRDHSESNLMGFERPVDGWDRILVVRYPNRRAFFRLITDPDYAKIMPYKLSAVELALVPVAAQVVIPDLRWVAAGLYAVIILAVGWVRAARTPAVAVRVDTVALPVSGAGRPTK
jgi:hypothetical protein